MRKRSNNVQVSVNVSKKLLNSIESSRKGLSRSDYIRQVLEKSENYRTEKNANGVVYTPQNLADYVSHKVLSYFFATRKNNNRFNIRSKKLKVIDPACGDGELLLAISKASFPIRGFSKKVQLDLFGIDIDKKSLLQTQKRLPDYHSFTPIHTNGLCPFQTEHDIGWLNLKKKYSGGTGFDIAIANPPWGADVKGYYSLLVNSNFSLLARQFDTSDLFIESMLSNIVDGGFIAFIVPDSLFYQERESLRRFLLSKTKIHFIGRFGEKIFKDVNRACAVVICEKGEPNDKHKIDCFRLSVEYRNLILAGNTDFHSAESELSHKVEQSRFKNNKNSQFNIDINDDLETTYNKILSQTHSLGDYLDSARGVELSKKGNVVQCVHCKKWSPLPSKEVFKCSHCRSLVTTLECHKEIIIHKQESLRRRPLIVGEHISRYVLKTDLWIDTSKHGIKYKSDSLYRGSKLIVRKTGIGISASIDYFERMTNQVVYIFRLKNKERELLPLEFFLALINSRMAFFLIAMSNGEIEWKSHPYVTQKQILDFPIPSVKDIPHSVYDELISICQELRKFLKAGHLINNCLDARCEMLIAKIYGLNERDYQSIYTAIDKSQELLSVKALKNIKINDIFYSKVV
ncbi:N-6 DNA methylase [Pseudidiomarina sp.]|uniref:N-6 DNA methylase n=1 Tax=Pseudidiomarina sp. TaxID=2081707 RepID=UPI003A97A436